MKKETHKNGQLDTGDERLQNNKLRLMRTELQDMVSLIDRAKQGKISLDKQVSYINKTKEDVLLLISEIVKYESDEEDDNTRHIINLWEQMDRSDLFKEDFTGKKIEEKLEAMTLLEEQAREAILYIGYKTIPERVNCWLEKARPGYILPFHLVFEDELQTEADRIKVLNYISWKPTEIKNGLVDPASGLIYRYHEKQTQRFFWVAIFSLLFPLTIYFMGSSFLLSSLHIILPSSNELNGEVLRLYLLSLFAGIYVHVLIDRTKVQQETGLPNIMPLSEWTRYISACRGRILYKVSLALFVFAAFLATTEKLESLTYAQFFLAGYSLDSVVNVFSARLQKSTSSRFSSSNA
ncbi:MAG TPA: hypothetical protein ENJ08_16185 [Gammaproteobacteria bacterium]|nr:hypothetical protein [Gammaproteobacteria bacterium]